LNKEDEVLENAAQPAASADLAFGSLITQELASMVEAVK
jgi:hypothetical protein